jgi:hypothetical protein
VISRDHFLRAGAFAMLVAPLLYAFLRAAEALLHPGGVDPTQIVIVGPSAYLRRCLMVAVLLPPVAIAGALLPAKNVLRALPVLVVTAPLAVVLVAVFAP